MGSVHEMFTVLELLSCELSCDGVMGVQCEVKCWAGDFHDQRWILEEHGSGVVLVYVEELTIVGYVKSC